MATSSSESPILKSLNQAQIRAVTSKASTVAILAGPGSGKTHTLTSRVVWLVQQEGYKPTDILVATFTVKAAREMKERIGKSLGEEIEKKIVLGTFHSISRRYLAAYGKNIGLDAKFTIADDGDSRAIIQRICKRLDLGIDPAFAKSWISKTKAKGTGNTPSQQKNSKQKDHPALHTCYKEYQDHLERSNLLDYDDLLVKCVELLRHFPRCVANIQAVLIDEYQDTNGIQYELMRLFAQARKRVTVVGDPDQSIYGWRSAEIRNLYRFLREYPQTEEIALEENYRSSQSILNVSLNVIQQDTKRYQKVLLPVHTKGSRPVLRKLKSSATEGEWIVTEIKRVVAMFGDMLKYEDVAILLRSAALSRHIESALGKAGVAYRMIGGHKFYDRKEIKVLLDYLRVIHKPDNNDAVARIINVPRRGIGEATIKSLLEEAEKAKLTLWEVLCKHCRGDRKATTNIRATMEQKLNTELLRIVNGLRQKAESITESSQTTLVDLIEQLISQLNFKKYLEGEFAEDHEGRWANVQELTNLVGDYMRDFGKLEEDQLPEIGDFEQRNEDSLLGRFLANVSLASDAQKDSKDGDKSSLLTISTIHAAKGLEWPIVFVPAVYTGSIPHSRSEDSDEERRLLYVAMTRAQALLYLSCPLYGGQGTAGKLELSPFVEPFASKAFAHRGPSFDRPVIESVAEILGREAPADKKVFGKLPPMFSIEDDIFPVDPADSKSMDNLDESGGHYARAPKRQRVNAPNMGTGYEAQERPWHREYATTMEQKSDFTVSGFTTASAHQTAVAAGVAAENLKARAIKATTKRGADQKSLLGFVATGIKAAKEVPPPPPENSKFSSYSRHQAAASRSASRTASLPAPKASLAPDFAEHKLPTAKPFSRPGMLKSATDASRKQYPKFSSSPPRPSAVDEGEEKVADPVSFKPATVFHATTFTSAARGNGGVRRPVGLGPPPSMNRLRKPFKPLTINKPSGPPR